MIVWSFCCADVAGGSVMVDMVFNVRRCSLKSVDFGCVDVADGCLSSGTWTLDVASQPAFQIWPRLPSKAHPGEDDESTVP